MARRHQWLFPVALLVLWLMAAGYTFSLITKNPARVSQPEVAEPIRIAAVAYSTRNHS